MERLKKSFTFYFGLVFLSLVFYQCCTGSFRISGMGNMELFEVGTSRADTISTAFNIFNFLEGEIVSQESKVNLFQSAWATSCDYENENPLIEESISLSLSRDIAHNGMAVVKGTSILNLEGVVFTDYNQEMEINVTNLFLDNTTILNWDYEITLSAETTDGILLEDKITTYFKFN